MLIGLVHDVVLLKVSRKGNKKYAAHIDLLNRDSVMPMFVRDGKGLPSVKNFEGKKITFKYRVEFGQRIENSYPQQCTEDKLFFTFLHEYFGD